MYHMYFHKVSMFEYWDQRNIRIYLFHMIRSYHELDNNFLNNNGMFYR